MTVFNTKPCFLMSALVVGTGTLVTACNTEGTIISDSDVRTDLRIKATPERQAGAASTDNAVDVTVYDPYSQADGTVTVTKAWLVVSEVDLEHEGEVEDNDDESDEDTDADYVGPYVVDLLAGESYPEIAPQTLDSGHYEGVEIEIGTLLAGDLDADGDPLIDYFPELADYSLYLEGSYTSEDEATYVDIPVVLSYEQAEEFELESDATAEGFTLDGGDSAEVIVAFRMASWFRFDDTATNDGNYSIEDAIEPDGAGGYELILGDDTHSEIRAVIEGNIKASADYGEDEDEDGNLDSDEDEDDDDEWDEFFQD